MLQSRGCRSVGQCAELSPSIECDHLISSCLTVTLAYFIDKHYAQVSRNRCPRDPSRYKILKIRCTICFFVSAPLYLVMSAFIIFMIFLAIFNVHILSPIPLSQVLQGIFSKFLLRPYSLYPFFALKAKDGSSFNRITYIYISYIDLRNINEKKL